MSHYNPLKPTKSHSNGGGGPVSDEGEPVFDPADLGLSEDESRDGTESSSNSDAPSPGEDGSPRAPRRTSTTRRSTSKISKIPQEIREKVDMLLKEGVPYKDIIALMTPQLASITEQNLSLYARKQYTRHAEMEERIAIEQARTRKRASSKIEALSEFQNLASQACAMARKALSALESRNDLTDPNSIKLLTAVLFSLPGISASARQTADFIAAARTQIHNFGRKPWEFAAILESASSPDKPKLPDPGPASPQSPPHPPPGPREHDIDTYFSNRPLAGEKCPIA